MDELRRSGRVPMGVRRIAGVAEIGGHAEVKAAAKEWATFSSDLQGDVDVRDYRQLPLEVDPPAHTAYRAILNPVFARPAVAALEPALRAIARRLVADARSRGTVDGVADLALPMVGGSIATAFGRPGDAAELTSWGLESWETFPDGRRSGARLDAYVGRVLDAPTADPGDDAFSRIATATVDGRPLTRTEMVGLANLILAGGRDTVILLLAGLLWHLGGRSADRAALAAEPGRIPTAIEELLRHLSPLPRMERVVTAAASGSWGSADPGDVVILGYGQANHDPAAFDEPDRIRLDRSPNPHVAFGNGPHTCIGVHLARLEGRVFLEELLAAVPDWRLGDGAVVRVERFGGATVPTRFDELPLVLGA